MHVRDLLELATVVATQAPAMLAHGIPVPTSSLERYWTTSRSRFDRWGHSLKRFSSQASTTRRRDISWLVARNVIEEILASEVLTRTWSAFLTLSDRRRRVCEAEPIARSVLIGQLEARHRAMNLLVHDPAVPAEHAVALNRLRHRSERWIDLLIGRMQLCGEVSEFAANGQRCREFAADLRRYERAEACFAGWPITLTAMRGSFSEGLDPLSANPELNAAIANSVLSGCGPEYFDSTGLLQSTWLARLTTVGQDSLAELEQLFAQEHAPQRMINETSPQRNDRYPQRGRFGC